MGKRKKKETAHNTGGQLVALLQQTLKAQQQKRPIVRPSQVLHENPYRGAKMYGYRQTMSANACHCRRTAQKINLIESITRHLTTRTRAYLRVSEAETEAGFQIKHKDAEREIGTREREEIKQIEQFFLNCANQPRLSSDNLVSYTAKLIRDYHSMDHFTGQVLYNPFGDIVGFCSVDSASIVPLQPSDREQTGFDYVQMVENLEQSFFKENEIVMSVGNPHNDINDLRLPGTPIVLTASDLLFSHIAAEQHNTDRFRKDNLPRGLMLMQGAKSTDDVAALQDWFAMVMNGDTQAMPWGIPLIPSLTEKEGGLQWVDLQQSHRDMEFSQLYEISMSIIASMFQVDLTDLGIHSSHSNRMETNQQLGRYIAAGSRSLNVILAFIESHLNQILALVTDEYSFEFTGKDQIDSAKEQADEQHKLRNYSSVNEVRAARDMETIGPGDTPIWDMPNTADARAAISTYESVFSINEIRQWLGAPKIKGQWADEVTARMAQIAYQQEQQGTSEAPAQLPGPEENTQSQIEPEIPDLTEITKSLNDASWPFKQLETTITEWTTTTERISRAIYRTLEHTLGLPKVVVQKSQDEPLIWKGEFVYDPESGRQVKKKDFDKLITALTNYIDRNAIQAKEIILSAELIGRIIGRAYLNGDDYESLAALEFGLDKVQYRGHNFADISGDIEGIKKLFHRKDVKLPESYQPAEKERARIEYSIDNAAYLLQKAGDELIHDVRGIITGSVIQQHSKRETAEALRMRLGEYNRDWLKIANTELADTHCAGLIAEIAAGTPADQPVLLERLELYDVAVCDVCKKYNHTVALLCESAQENDTAPEGSPADYLIWPGKNNFRRKKKDWWLTYGTIHPNCRGSWRLYNERQNKRARERYASESK